MKLTMEFEDADLRDMIDSYFESRGFKVENADELVEKFAGIFPQGIKVKVQVIDIVETTVSTVPPPSPPPSASPKPATTKRLSMADLMDPSVSIEEDMRHILLQNNELLEQ